MAKAKAQASAQAQPRPAEKGDIFEEITNAAAQAYDDGRLPDYFIVLGKPNEQYRFIVAAKDAGNLLTQVHEKLLLTHLRRLR